MNELHGAGVALITPFDADGTIDFNALGHLIDHQLDGGMNYLVSLGTTGETATLSAQERKDVWKYTAEKVDGRVPLVAGIGGNNTAEIVEQIQDFDNAGYQAVLSVNPYYNKPTQEGIYQHYKAVAEASPLPIILYNVPGRTGSNITPETTVRLAHNVANIVATKEASGNYEQFSKIMRDKPKDFILISGDDGATLPMMALGAVGTISVVANAFPTEVAHLTRLCLDGNFEEARQIHSKLLHITDLCFMESNPAGVKSFLAHLGITTPHVRLPLVEASENLTQAIKVTLDGI